MKRILALLLAGVALLAFLPGCSDGQNGGDKPAEYTGEMADGGNTYAEASYYPIVKEPITLTAAFYANPTLGDITARTLWAKQAELTGISFELRVIAPDNGETVSLLYASRDYPDISFRLDYGSALARDAGLLGDTYELTDEMLQKYAPNWWRIFQEYPEIYRMSCYPDGKLYALPSLTYAEPDIEMRDVWLINSQWLDELGLAMPETIDDYTNYLRAVKNAAGTGSIPSNVVPLWTLNTISNIGSWYTIADTFGLYNGVNDEIVENGQVKSNLQNPLFKQVMKYMSLLYSEKLMNTDFAAAKWNDYVAAVDYNNEGLSVWNVGSYFAYTHSEHEFMTFMPMVTTSSGHSPTIRAYGLANRLSQSTYIIFKNCKYPVAALRWADYFASTEGSLEAGVGVKGVAWDKREDGTYEQLKVELELLDDADKGYGVYGPYFISEETIKQLSRDIVNNPRSRYWAYYNIYKKYIPDDKQIYPTAANSFLSQEEQEEIRTITTKIENMRYTIVVRWISGKGDIDAEWDTYQQKFLDLGIGRLLELQQKAYQLYTGSGS